MTGTNHIATGAVIGAVLAAPVAVPAAIASHFVLDALPHFGQPELSWRSRRYIVVIGIDALLVLSIAIAIVITKPLHWRLMLAGGFLAMSPDLTLLPNYIREMRTQARKPRTHRFTQWHARIQREYAWGLVAEIAWLLIIMPFLFRML